MHTYCCTYTAIQCICHVETKFVEDYLVSSNGLDDKAERQPLRYTTLEFADEE